MSFVNLYTETEYSILNSPSKLDNLINLAKEYKYDALAITDINNMHGAIKFYTKCIDNNIKPIIGLHLRFMNENVENSLLFYAMNNSGYRNLLKLATIAKRNKEDYNLLNISKYSDDCIVIIPGDENQIISSFIKGDIDLSRKTLNEYKEIFKNLYVGLDVQSKIMINKMDEIIYYINDNGLKSVALNKTSYLCQEDLPIYKVLKCIGLSCNEYEEIEKERNSFLINPNKAFDMFRKYKTLITETENISKLCNVNIEFGKYRMPVYLGTDNTNKYLRELSLIGLRKRLIKKEVILKDYIERLNYELDIIERMGFCDYFLIVFDFIRYAKKNGILVGPGRGSAASSLVSYSIGITDIDPLENELLFERFLNPERISMPDIDVDFPDNRRDEVIKYVGKKYGKERVAHILTFGTFGARLAIRDVARVKKMSDAYLDEILKYVDSNTPSISVCLDNYSILKQMYEQDELVRETIDIVLKLEGLPRNISTHAAGIIMADDELVKYTALQDGMNGLSQTQFEASDLEKIGLVKIDFLGIRNLTIINDIIKMIGPSFKLNEISFSDEQTYKLIASGDTDGIFQISSDGMKNVLIQMKTSSFIDIVNAVALYRPGPMDIIPSFIRRKFNKEEVQYIHDDLKDILKPTYGTIVYQEQILLIAQKFAGYSLGEADILRRAVSKKNNEMLANERNRFVEKASSKGYSKDVSNNIYNYIVKFANYGFNKSHSVVYSTIAYQMAYLKCHYYDMFMCVLMNNSLGSIPLIKKYILSCNKHKIVVCPPSINKSTERFELIDKKIYYSLLGVSDVGGVTISELLKDRNENGVYQTYDDFISRTKGFLSKKTVESLICSGACDEFKITRRSMMEEYDKSIEISNYGEAFKEVLSKHEFSEDEYTIDEISSLERKAIGFNIKYDVFKKYDSIRKKYKTIEICDLDNHIDSPNSYILFSISKIKIIKTKNNDEMAFLEIEDRTSSCDAVLFPTVFKEFSSKLFLNSIYLGLGKIEKRNNKIQVVLNKLYLGK